jgi:integrase
VPKLTKRLVEAIEPTGRDVFLWDDAVKGFGLRVYPSGDRSYVFQYKPRGCTRSTRITIGSHGPITVEEARAQALQLRAEVIAGGDPLVKRVAERTALTVKEAAERFLAEHSDVDKKPSSAASDRRNLRLHVLPMLGMMRIRDVTRQHVSDLHHSLHATPTNANRVLALVSTIMNKAEAWGLRPDGSNPCRHVRRFRESRRERFLSLSELARLGEALAEAEASGGEPAAAIAALRLLVFTGARRGEILELRWQHVDLEHGCLRLPDSKTGARAIPLNAPALQVLSRLRESRGESDWVIRGARRGQPFVGLHRVWERIRESAGLGDVRVHDLRHSFASMAAGSGLSLPVIGRMLGHRVPTTTARYAHLADDPLRQASELTAAKIAAAMAGDAKADVIPFRS